MQNLATTLMLIVGAYASNSNKPYLSGMVVLNEPVSYGRYKAKIRTSNRKGTASSFYLSGLEDGLESVHSNWNAITVVPSMEKEGRICTKISEDRDDQSWQCYEDSRIDTQFNEYEIEWTPQYLKYSFNGQVIRYRSITASKMTETYDLVMSIESIDEKQEPGYGFDASLLPTRTSVDWFEKWDYDVETSVFFRDYRDEFDNLDKWYPAEMNSGENNTSNFEYEQAYVQNGELVLRLEENRDQKEPDPKPETKPEPEQSSDEPKKEPGFHHDLPAPQDGTLDAAIEKATRAYVTSIRNFLESFAQDTANHYSQ